MPSIRDLPIADRPRERFRSHGARALTTAELLALLLSPSAPGRSSVDMAHLVLHRAGGSLRRLSQLPVATLTDLPGLGEAKALALYAALEVGRRLHAEDLGATVMLRGAYDVYRWFAPRLEGLTVEEFHVAVLDTQCQVTRDLLITRGILDGSLVHPREVFREAIAERAASIVLVHNHPSGDPTPSPDDMVMTRQLVDAGKLLGIPVSDHVIVGRGRYVGMAESGLL